MATILDDQFSQAAVGAAVSSMVNGMARREIFAAADAEQRLSDLRAEASGQRNANLLSNRLLDNRMIEDNTGEDNSLADEILAQRAAEYQPQEQTYNDPNYRAGAPAPAAPA